MIIQFIVIERSTGPIGHMRIGNITSEPFRSKERAIDILLMLSEYGVLTDQQQMTMWYAIHGSLLPEKEDQVGTIIALPLSELQYITIALSKLFPMIEYDGHDPSRN